MSLITQRYDVVLDDRPIAPRELLTSRLEHTSRGEPSSDPLLADQMTVTVRVGSGAGVWRWRWATSSKKLAISPVRRDAASPSPSPSPSPRLASFPHSCKPPSLPRYSHIRPAQPHPSPPSPPQSTLGSFQFASRLAPGFPGPVKRQAICCAPRLMPRRALNTHIKSWRLNRFSFANLYRTEVQSVSLEVYTP